MIKDKDSDRAVQVLGALAASFLSAVVMQIV